MLRCRVRHAIWNKSCMNITAQERRWVAARGQKLVSTKEEWLLSSLFGSVSKESTSSLSTWIYKVSRLQGVTV